MPDYKELMKKKNSPKNSPKRDRQEIKRSGKLLNKAAFLLLLSALILSSYFGARSFLLRFPGFRISRVFIVDANGKPLRNYEDIFPLDSGYNLFNFDMERTVGDIRARHPELAGVCLRKQFPNKLLIVVKEREPLALIASSADSYLVDAQGFILPFKSIYRNLPKIIGVHPKRLQLYTNARSLRLKKALELLKELKKRRIYPEYNVSQIDVRRYADIIFYLENRIEVRMGQSGFERKVALLSRILTQLKASDTVPKYIDMRFDNPVVKP